MIQGVVNSRREAVVSLRLRGPAGIEAEVDAVIDTGYTGSLTLSAATVSALGLTFQSARTLRLADGTKVRVDTYSAELEWDGGFRPILVSVIGQQPLVGTRLLAGHQMWAEFAPGGAVTVEPLP